MQPGKILTAVLFVTFLSTPHAFAFEALAPAQAAAIADTVTTANPDANYKTLLENRREGLVSSIKSDSGGKIDQDAIDKSKQTVPLADNDWLKASGYDFAVKDNQDAGIKVLSPFLTLPRWELERSQMTVTEINHLASTEQQQHAIVDAQSIAYLYFIPEALGPKLGPAFLKAYEAGEIGKAAALIKASEISTGAAKAYFNYPRPFLIDNSTIQPVPDNSVSGDGTPYAASGGAFPSGHTNTGYTDGLLLAEMLPERFTALIDRSAGYGYSRVVLGVHYPLDVIGSRMIVERNVAHFLSDPAYKKLFDEAREQLRTALEKECGASIAECAEPADAASDPWAAPALRDFYDFTMTYALPRSGEKDIEMVVPEGAEILLATLFPEKSAAERQEILKRTALDSGYPLDSRDRHFGFWQRINLHEAALAAQTN
ncbi:acid phosphatase [Rhizobium sp. SYY.PMSO]|uniref:acid phosphatase n=1 Tax=Rhizobium sp. SYY.PMSO TaxID=3382192 RepID=UPI00398FEDC8